MPPNPIDPTSFGTYTDTEDVVYEPITAEVGGLVEVMKDDGRWLADGVNWFYRNFVSTDGRGLYDVLLEPIAGNFNEIKANGERWEAVKEMYNHIGKNLSDNTSKLIPLHWEGDAAQAFWGNINLAWTPGLLITEFMANLVAKGFTKLSEFSIDVAEKCAKVIEEILERILKLAVKCLPGVGWMVALVDWVASGFDEFPYFGDVEMILNLISFVEQMQEKISQLVASLDKYLTGLGAVLDALGNIPNIDSTRDALDVVGQFSAGQDDMAEAEKEIKKLKKDMTKELENATPELPAAPD